MNGDGYKITIFGWSKITLGKDKLIKRTLGKKLQIDLKPQFQPYLDRPNRHALKQTV